MWSQHSHLVPDVTAFPLGPSLSRSVQDPGWHMALLTGTVPLSLLVRLPAGRLSSGEGPCDVFSWLSHMVLQQDTERIRRSPAGIWCGVCGCVGITRSPRHCPPVQVVSASCPRGTVPRGHRQAAGRRAWHCLRPASARFPPRWFLRSLYICRCRPPARAYRCPGPAYGLVSWSSCCSGLSLAVPSEGLAFWEVRAA